MSAHFLQTLLASLPAEYAAQLENLCHSDNHKVLLETVIRFIAGGECDAEASALVKQEWSQKQLAARAALSTLVGPNDQKRAREDDSLSPENGTKRQKLPEPTSAVDDPPVLSLNFISVSSPVRKKVNVTIHKHSIKFINPTSKAIEADIPLSSLRRTFILPTRGKQKPHWTVVILSSDAPERGKPPASSTQPKPQIIFGLDAVASAAMTSTTYSDSSEPKTYFIGKGSDTLPTLRKFLSHVGLTILQPTPEVFRSACPGNTNTSASPDGIPGIEAYRAAKPGTLWFFKEGILFGENKPCEFWAVEDLIGKVEGLRMLSATGRTCSVILTRSDPDAAAEDGEEDIGVETEFAMVDGKEQEGINQWVRQHRHLFGKKSGSADEVTPAVTGGSGTAASNITAGPATITGIQLDEGSDASDDSFDMDSDDDDGGSATSSDSSDAGDGSNAAGSADESAEGEETDAEEEGEEEHEQELKPQHHPLMRPGAMPRMSRAAIDAVVGMVNDDLMGGGEGDGEDELMDD